MNDLQWTEEFRKQCAEERDDHIKRAEMLESGVFRVGQNYVDVSADWAQRNRRIAAELDELIGKIDEDIREIKGR